MGEFLIQVLGNFWFRHFYLERVAEEVLRGK
jgi:hypothetical protein